MDEMTMAFDKEEAKGVITLRRGHDGADVLVDGKLLGWIDLFPPTEGNPPQFIVDAPDETHCKLILEKNGVTVIVNGDATIRRGPHPHAVHSDDRDLVVRPIPDPEHDEEEP